MTLIIIFGTTGITMTKQRGQFFCPQCSSQMDYVHKRVRRFFTLYFIPLVPLDLIGEYVECANCQGTFHLEILNYDPAQQRQSGQALFYAAMKQVMIAMLLADGVIDDAEVAELKATFESLTNLELTETDIREEIAHVQQHGGGTIELVTEMAGVLNDKGKEMVVVAAYQIAHADGQIDAAEQQLLREIGQALQLSPAHLRGILAELENPQSTDVAV